MRTLYGRGAQGGVVESIQRRLTALGHPTNGIDGLYGNNTVRAVQAFQIGSHFQKTDGIVDDATWQTLMGVPPPPISVRALELTAAFEGHGYTLAEGNWDGAWLTWGIVGFTMKAGEIQKMVLDLANSARPVIDGAFGDHAQQLIDVMNSPAKQEAWANSITVAEHRVAEPWLTGFRLLGQVPQVQEMQRKKAFDDYFVPAQKTARDFGLQLELGVALCFDIHVQNGSGVIAAAKPDINNAIAAHPPADERARRDIIANAIANHVGKFAADVRMRKLTIADGSGTVHGGNFLLANWGLGEFPA